MKNCGDRGGCYPSRLQAEADNIVRNLHNSSYDTKAEFNNCFIIHSQKFLVKKQAKTWLPPLIVHVNQHVQERKDCLAPKIFSTSRCRPSSCLLAVLFSQKFAYFLLVKRVKCSVIFALTTKATKPRPRVFFFCTIDLISSMSQIFSKIGKQWLAMMNYACDFSQSETQKYFE